MADLKQFSKLPLVLDLLFLTQQHQNFSSFFLALLACSLRVFCACYLLLFSCRLLPQAKTRKETKENFPEEEILKIFMTSSSLDRCWSKQGWKNIINIIFFNLYLPASTYSGAINKRMLEGSTAHNKRCRMTFNFPLNNWLKLLIIT